jgi:hypothetical protein
LIQVTHEDDRPRANLAVLANLAVVAGIETFLEFLLTTQTGTATFD